MTKDNKEKKLIAKRDFLICQNEFLFKIEKGDDIKELKIPEQFIQNLKTENVI